MLTAIAIILSILIISFLLPAGTPGIHLAKGSDPTKTIALLEKVNICGSTQWILERSENTDNPIILFLHGGPGNSQLTLNRRNTRDIEKSFIVVNWDQRGAGKSFKAINDTDKMNIEQFIEDTKELTMYLLTKFGKEKLFLAGHSWGSVIGVLTVSKYPELYHCYIGIGQVANMEENEKVSYQWTLNQAIKVNDKKAIKILKKIGIPPYPGDWLNKTIAQRRLLSRFGGEVHKSRIGASGMVIRSIIFSHEYSLLDRVNILKGLIGSMKLLWPQLLKVNLFKIVPEFKLPVYFMEGRFDWEVPSELAQRYFKTIKAPSKEFIWFEKSSHMVNSEERDKFNSILVDKILPSYMYKQVN